MDGIEFDQLAVGGRRLRAIHALMPLLLKLKSKNATYVARATAARRAFNQVSPELAPDDAAALDTTCDVAVEDLWRYTVGMVRDGGEKDVEAISAELGALTATPTLPSGYEATWDSVEHLLQVALTQAGSRKPAWDEVSDDMFKAFRTINEERHRDDSFEEKNRELYELSYRHLVGWKDALPVQPGILTRRRINAEKRRIQEYWLLRKEYGM